MIAELLTCCTVEQTEHETVYIPLGAPSSEYVSMKLDISQYGVVLFHRALKRLGRPLICGLA